MKSCSNSVLEVDTGSRSMFRGTSLFLNRQVSVHSWTTDIAFMIDEDLVANTTLLMESRGHSISLVISSPRGDSIDCRPRRTQKLRPSAVLKQVSSNP